MQTISFDERAAWCALNKIFGYHPHSALRLIERAGTALALFDGSWANASPTICSPSPFAAAGAEGLALRTSALFSVCEATPSAPEAASATVPGTHPATVQAGSAPAITRAGGFPSGAEMMVDASTLPATAFAHAGGLPSGAEIIADAPAGRPRCPEAKAGGVADLLAQLVPSQLDWGRRELEQVYRRGFRFLCLADEDYPSALRECEDPPLGLYLNGCSAPTEIFGLRPMVGVVGTRDISPYGREWCRRLVQALAQARVQPCIVSGLAFGADSIAHRTALECGLHTIGVMATGIEQIYPYQHERLAVDIVSTPGCGLVTDYPLNTAPVALNFVRRNRIIAGLVSGVIVVESKTKGGSLMTAKYACNYSRDVFAVPGRLDDVRSAGCLSLIHADMARIVTSPEELVADLGLGTPSRGAGGSWKFPQEGASPEEVLRCALTRRYGPGSPLIPVALAVQSHRGATPEELSALLGSPFPQVLSSLGTLEADGFVTSDLLRRYSLSHAN